MNAKRIRYVVSPVRRAHGWQLTRKATAAETYRTQAEAIAAGVRACRELLQAGGLAELIIKAKDGRIRDSRTYGRDPRSTRG